jgi:hypothetical protein
MADMHAWVAAFIALNERKPRPEEFQAAKRADFSLTQLGAIPEDKAQSTWLAAFEQTNSRKPSPQEFMEAKKEGFSLSGFAEFDAPAPLSQHYQQQYQQQAFMRQYQQSQAAGVVKKPLPKHFKLIAWLVGVGVILVWLLASAGYFFFNYFGNSATGFTFYWTHQQSSLTRYVEDYNTKPKLGSQDLSWYVWADTKKPIESKDIKYRPTLPSKISVAKLLPGTQMEEVGKKFLIFPDYKVVVTPQRLNMSANAEALTLTVNTTKIATSDSADYSTSLRRLFPGSYKVSAKGTVKKVAIDMAQKITATGGTTQAAFDLKFITFHLYSNVADGDVYVGGSLIGKLTGDDYKFNDIPVLAGQDLRVEKEFKDGVVKTDSAPVNGIVDGDSVHLDWAQELSTDTASDLLDNAAAVLTGYSLSNDIDSEISDVFSGGQDNDVFKHFKKSIDKNLKSTDNPTGMKASDVYFDNFNVTKIKQTSVNRYEVHFSMRWDFYYSNDTAYGHYYETDSYVVTVEYKPMSNEEDWMDVGAGDASNFLIGDLVSGPSDTSVDKEIESF